MKKEIEPKKCYFISPKFIVNHPVLDNFSGALLSEKDAEELDNLEPNSSGQITQEYIIALARKFSTQYTELEAMTEHNDWLYEELEETIGVYQAKMIVKLCYIIGWCDSKTGI